MGYQIWRMPAEAVPTGKFIEEEMEARGWSMDDLHRRLPDPMTCLAVDMLIAVHDKNLILDDETAAAIGAAFGTSSELWTNLDRAWRGVQ